MSNVQGQYWCFTLNNYSDEDEKHIASLDEPTYLVYGREVGESGTPHLQGYIEFGRRVRLTQLVQLLGGRAHVERRKSSDPKQAADYCKKDGDFFESGSLSTPKRGKRSDLGEMAEALVGGATHLDLFDLNPTQWIIHRRGLADASALLRPAVDRPNLRVFVLWGDSGFGKSRYVRLAAPEVWSVPNVDLKWFDGYQGQESVVIDDYDGRQTNMRDFLRYMDIYRVMAPVKGGFVAWNPTTIWITSNIDPSGWHLENVTAVRRRLTKVVRLRTAIDFSNDQHINSMNSQFI